MIRIIAILFASLLANISFGQKNLSSRKLSIEINSNAELLGLAYFIGFEGVDIEKKTVEINGKKMPKKDWHNYGYFIYEKYKKYAESENLANCFSVAGHLWLDYLLSLLVQVDNFPNAVLPPTIDKSYYLNFSLKKDSTEARKNAITFLNGFNKFYTEIDFKQYLEETKPYYESALQQVRDNLPKTDFIAVMEGFYRKNFDHYLLVPSLTIPKGMGFGLRYNTGKETTVLNVFGAFDMQSFQQAGAPDMGFANPQRLRELSVHEFGHSFVNPSLDKVPDERFNASQKLFEPLKSAMSDQGYNTWKVCLYEHFVRAGEVVIAETIGNEKDAENLRSSYINERKFQYLPVIISRLKAYSKSKENYDQVVSKVMDDLAKLE